MPSTAPAAAEPNPARLELYRLRDELAQSYAPTNAHERMLVAQIAQGWTRLQRAYEAEERFFEEHDILQAIGSIPDQFKAVTRYVGECERAWRHAVTSLQKGRTLKKTDLSSPYARRSPSVRQSEPAGKPENSPEIHPMEKFDGSLQRCGSGDILVLPPNGSSMSDRERAIKPDREIEGFCNARTKTSVR